MQLNQLSALKTGIFLQQVPFGEAVYLQARQFDAGGRLTSALIADVPVVEKHLLQAGDILFAAKGLRNFAMLYQPEWGKCVASSTFLVIKPLPQTLDIVLPEFLTWFLNLPQVQSKLQKDAMGTALPLVSKSMLAALEIPIPPLHKQRQLLNIVELLKSEEALQAQLKIQKQQLFNHQLSFLLQP